MKRILLLAACGLLVAAMSNPAFAQKKTVNRKAPPSAEAVLAQAAETGKFTFIIFYRDDTVALQKMRKVVEEGVAARAEQATIAYADVEDAGTDALVERYGLARTPLPLTLGVAPNGAVTGIFSKQLTDENLDAAIVTPTMTRCMKSLQEQKLVFVCVRATAKAPAPQCIKQMQAEPDFKERVVVFSMRVDDPQEERLIKQMKLDPADVDGSVAVLLAPPGVLIGKYGAEATSDDVVTALNKAGKCCDDPNCKHNREKAAPQAKKPGTNLRSTK